MDKITLVTQEPGAGRTLQSALGYHTPVNPQENSSVRSAAWRLIVSLENAGLRINAAYWAFDENENGRWRLFIASPEVDKQGPLKTYQRIQSVLQQNPDLGEIDLDDISVLGTKDARLVSLAKQIPGLLRKGNKRLDVGAYVYWFFERYFCYLFSPPTTN